MVALKISMFGFYPQQTVPLLFPLSWSFPPWLEQAALLEKHLPVAKLHSTPGNLVLDSWELDLQKSLGVSASVVGNYVGGKVKLAHLGSVCLIDLIFLCGTLHLRELSEKIHSASAVMYSLSLSLSLFHFSCRLSWHMKFCVFYTHHDSLWCLDVLTSANDVLMAGQERLPQRCVHHVVVGRTGQRWWYPYGLGKHNPESIWKR